MSLYHNLPLDGPHISQFGSDALDSQSHGSVICKNLIFLYVIILMKYNVLIQDGIGQLKVVDGGVQLEGQAIILDELRTSHVRSRFGQPITFGK